MIDCTDKVLPFGGKGPSRPKEDAGEEAREGKRCGERSGDGDRKDVGEREKGLEMKYLSLKASTHLSVTPGQTDKLTRGSSVNYS